MHHWRLHRRARPTSGAVEAVANGVHKQRRNLWAAQALRQRAPARAALASTYPYPILIIFDI